MFNMDLTVLFMCSAIVVAGAWSLFSLAKRAVLAKNNVSRNNGKAA